ncbi:MAG TPA: hypothetical protein VF462_00125, partial [Micromonosporaceae bacterium]
LRRMFAGRAAPVPATADAAGSAIRRARGIRRRRNTATSIAAAAALVVTVAGITSAGGWNTGADRRWTAPIAPFDTTAGPADPIGPTAAPSVTALMTPRTENRLGLDLLSGNQLLAADGRRIALTEVGEITRIYRISAGWVYGGADEVRLMRADGTSTSLIHSAKTWIVSTDGSRLAVVTGAALHIGRIEPSGLVVQPGAAVPAGAVPVTFVGNRVVLAAPSSSGGFDLLDPARPARPAWNRDVLAVYGPHGSGLAGLVRRAGSPAPCVALLKAVPGLPVERSGRCTADLPPAGAARLSPSGAWLAGTDPTGVTFLDVARAVAGNASLIRCGVQPAVPPVWVGSTVATSDGRNVVRCHSDGRRDELPPPDGIGPGWRLVPRLEPSAPTPPRTAGPTKPA